MHAADARSRSGRPPRSIDCGVAVKLLRSTGRPSKSTTVISRSRPRASGISSPIRPRPPPVNAPTSRPGRQHREHQADDVRRGEPRRPQRPRSRTRRPPAVATPSVIRPTRGLRGWPGGRWLRASGAGSGRSHANGAAPSGSQAGAPGTGGVTGTVGEGRRRLQVPTVLLQQVDARRPTRRCVTTTWNPPLPNVNASAGNIRKPEQHRLRLRHRAVTLVDQRLQRGDLVALLRQQQPARQVHRQPDTTGQRECDERDPHDHRVDLVAQRDTGGDAAELAPCLRPHRAVGPELSQRVRHAVPLPSQSRSR